MWEKDIKTRIMSKLISSFCLFVYFFKAGVSNFSDLRTKLGIADVVSCSQILNLSADFKRTTALKKKKKKKKKIKGTYFVHRGARERVWARKKW